MKTRFLLPNKFKLIGWILVVPSAILGFLIIFFDFELSFLEFKVFVFYSSSGFGDSTIFSFDNYNLTKTIAGVIFLVGAIMVAFAKEKHEDEFLSKIRLESLLWATYINYVILLLCFLFIYDFGFVLVMIFNMFTILILFIIRFNYILYRTSKSIQHEKQS